MDKKEELAYINDLLDNAQQKDLNLNDMEKISRILDKHITEHLKDHLSE